MTHRRNTQHLSLAAELESAIQPEIQPEAHLARLRWVITLASLSITIATIALPIYTAQFKLSGIELGELLSVGALMAALSRPLTGRAMDRLGRKVFLLMGAALMVLATLIFAVAHNTPLLFLASTLHGLGLGTLLVAAYTITADLASASGRGSHFGLIEESQQRGGLLGIVLMGALVLLTGYDGSGQFAITQRVWMISFGLYAVGAIASLALIWRGITETYSAVYLITPQAQPAQNDPPLAFDRQLFTLIAVVFLTSASAYASQPILLKYISEHITSSLAWIALSYAPSAILVSVLPSHMGRFADKYGRKLPMLLGLGANAVFSAAVPILRSIGALTLFASLESLCYSAAVPAEQAMVADLTGGQQRGLGFGLYTLAQSGGKVLGYLAMGALYDIVKQGPFILNTVVLTVCMLLVWFVLRNSTSDKVLAAKPVAQ